MDGLRKATVVQDIDPLRQRRIQFDGGERTAAGGAADHGARIAHRGVDLRFAHRAMRHARVLDAGGRVVAAPAEQQQLDPDALVQRTERSDAVRRDEVRHERDRLGHRSASS